MIEASAPGKLVIVGEYAVLHGAPAIVTAVGVKAIARLSATGSACCSLSSAAGIDYFFVPGEDGRLEWPGGKPEDRSALIEAVWSSLCGGGGLDPGLPGVEIVIDTAAFYRDAGSESRKLGLGSSAAAVVAFAGALWRVSGRRGGGEFERACFEAHARLQGGGSGVDVAAALRGGVLAFRRDEAAADPVIETLRWPQSLEVLPVWSGINASTPRMLARIREFAMSRPAAWNKHIRVLTAAGVAALDAWRLGNAADIVGRLAEYDAALRAMDRAAGIGIESPEHAVIRALVEHHGAVYKTSGAGGGDFGLAISDSTDVIRAIRIELESRRLLMLPDAHCAAGLSCSGEA